jgi:hypothetical protein
MLAWVRCFLRDRHEPTRHFLGGFRCTDCGATGPDLSAMGFHDQGYVSLERLTRFHIGSRDHTSRAA